MDSISVESVPDFIERTLRNDLREAPGITRRLRLVCCLEYVELLCQKIAVETASLVMDDTMERLALPLMENLANPALSDAERQALLEHYRESITETRLGIYGDDDE